MGGQPEQKQLLLKKNPGMVAYFLKVTNYRHLTPENYRLKTIASCLGKLFTKNNEYKIFYISCGQQNNMYK